MLKKEIVPPLLSIIIPCFNDPKNIQRAVRSALNQKYFNKEVIVVDDGSDFVTKKVLEKVELDVDHLITHSINRGTSAARNTGIENANGEIIMVLDSDDYFDPEFSEEAISILEKKVDVKLVTCFIERFSEKSSIDIVTPKSGELSDFLKYNCATGSSMFRRRDWKACGGYDEVMRCGFEDWEFFIRLLEGGGRSYVIPSVMYHYMLRKNSRTTKANKQKYDLMKYIYSKHKDLYIRNYDLFIDHLLNRVEMMENGERKTLNKIEFKIGMAILQPFRFIKSIFRKVST